VVGQLTLDQSTVVRIHVPEPPPDRGVRQHPTPYVVSEPPLAPSEITLFPGVSRPVWATLGQHIRCSLATQMAHKRCPRVPVSRLPSGYAEGRCSVGHLSAECVGPCPHNRHKTNRLRKLASRPLTCPPVRPATKRESRNRAIQSTQPSVPSSPISPARAPLPRPAPAASSPPAPPSAPCSTARTARRSCSPSTSEIPPPVALPGSCTSGTRRAAR
jgi:hypothetical protein